MANRYVLFIPTNSFSGWPDLQKVGLTWLSNDRREINPERGGRLGDLRKLKVKLEENLQSYQDLVDTTIPGLIWGLPKRQRHWEGVAKQLQMRTPDQTDVL